MSIIIHIDDSSDKAKAFITYAKSLDFTTIKNLNELELNDELDEALAEHKAGTAEYQDWDSVKAKLFSKYKSNK